MHRGHDLLQLEVLEPADPPQRVVDLRALDLELALVGEHLPRHTRMVRLRGYPLGAGLEHLHGAGVRIASLALVHDRAHAIARDRSSDEHHITAVPEPCDALSAEGERVDPQLQLVAPLRAGEGLIRVRRSIRDDPRIGAHAGEGSGMGASKSSSSAFCA